VKFTVNIARYISTDFVSQLNLKLIDAKGHSHTRLGKGKISCSRL